MILLLHRKEIGVEVSYLDSRVSKRKVITLVRRGFVMGLNNCTMQEINKMLKTKKVLK